MKKITLIIENEEQNNITFADIHPNILAKTKLSEKGIENLLLSLTSRYQEDRKYFSVYTKKSKSLLIAKKEVTTQGIKISVEDVIDGSIFISTGLLTHNIDDIPNI